jgi:anti-anti-sigma factor
MKHCPHNGWMTTWQPAPGGRVVIDVDRRADAVVVRVAGDVEMSTSGDVQDAVIRALDEQPGAVVVDLDAVSFLGSDGLAALISCQKHAASSGRLRVVVRNPIGLRPIQLTGLDSFIAVYASQAEALAGH